MAAMDQLHNFFVGSKTKLEMIQIVQSHSQQYGYMQVIFSRFYKNSKWPPQNHFIIVCGRNLKDLK